MAAIQLNFTLRTSSKCKTVHLVGSWDTYKSHLPLAKDSSKSGGWRGTFRFTPPTLQPGQRYWYYYIIDGYHVSHDPAREHTTEPTTGRKLNILDIPGGRPAVSSSHGGGGHHTYIPGGSRRHASTANGRSLSPSQIQHPYPSRPYETRVFRSAEMEALSRRYAAQRLSDRSSDDGSSSDSDGSSDRSSLPSLPSLSSRSSHSSSPSSVSSIGSCSCQRYAVLKDGRKVRVDCGGTVCGSSESSSGDDRRSKSKSSKSSSRRSGKVRR